VCKADNLPQSCAVVTKSGNLNFLEPSGPVQDCNGTAFYVYLHMIMDLFIYFYLLILTVQNVLIIVAKMYLKIQFTT